MTKCSSLAKAFAWVLTLRVVTGQAEISVVDPCGQGCINDLAGRAAEFGCEAGSFACFCTNQDFTFGARDCAQQSCGQAVADQVNVFATAVCAAASPPNPTPTPTNQQLPPPPAQEANPPADSTPAERPTPEQAPQSTATESTSTEVTTSATLTTSTRAAAATTSSASPNGAEQSDDDDDNEASGPTGSEEQNNDEQSSQTGLGGLSVAAKAGIGASIGVVGLSALLVALFLFLRRRSKKSGAPSHGYKISGPMPGSGRDYADSHSDFGKEHHGTSELEMTSRRYEDMLPRAQPSSMI
ncbi:hypothetical protein jhhlp_006038 [Lomentospora prolificans]|uniref:CFEM domain-containing protein n=1 Tax=Lomentospora prolificans TaxID=41688 RepID=A0A2N3N4U0_9PEZI|nr:hypothetical protein jhhlp_006038 [Lomentospora prolificans]